MTIPLTEYIQSSTANISRIETNFSLGFPPPAFWPLSTSASSILFQSANSTTRLVEFFTKSGVAPSSGDKFKIDEEELAAVAGDW
jgi:hypothetical protein